MTFTSLHWKAGRKALGLAMAVVAVIAIQHATMRRQNSRPLQLCFEHEGVTMVNSPINHTPLVVVWNLLLLLLPPLMPGILLIRWAMIVVSTGKA